jgi:hypothetical protein
MAGDSNVAIRVNEAQLATIIRKKSVRGAKSVNNESK